jgi:hypothetical protein
LVFDMFLVFSNVTIILLFIYSYCAIRLSSGGAKAGPGGMFSNANSGIFSGFHESRLIHDYFSKKKYH